MNIVIFSPKTHSTYQRQRMYYKKENVLYLLKQAIDVFAPDNVGYVMLNGQYVGPVDPRSLVIERTNKLLGNGNVCL